jgi:hypothetical protein
MKPKRFDLYTPARAGPRSGGLGGRTTPAHPLALFWGARAGKAWRGPVWVAYCLAELPGPMVRPCSTPPPLGSLWAKFSRLCRSSWGRRGPSSKFAGHLVYLPSHHTLFSMAQLAQHAFAELVVVGVVKFAVCDAIHGVASSLFSRFGRTCASGIG